MIAKHRRCRFIDWFYSVNGFVFNFIYPKVVARQFQLTVSKLKEKFCRTISSWLLIESWRRKKFTWLLIGRCIQNKIFTTFSQENTVRYQMGVFLCCFVGNQLYYNSIQCPFNSYSVSFDNVMHIVFLYTRLCFVFNFCKFKLHEMEKLYRANVHSEHCWRGRSRTLESLYMYIQMPSSKSLRIQVQTYVFIGLDSMLFLCVAMSHQTNCNGTFFKKKIETKGHGQCLLFYDLYSYMVNLFILILNGMIELALIWLQRI